MGARRAAGIATSTTVAAVAGAIGWTATEYGLHRFAMHELRGRGLASREHLQHHADVTYFSPTPKKLLSAAATTTVVLPASLAVAGRRKGIAFTTGLIAMYFGYEVAHRRCHTHPPKTAYGRWMRRSHLYHHFGGPMRNFGVTTVVYDRLLGTYDEPGTVTVPRRMAPVWMVDEAGDVLPEFAPDYVTKGRRRGTPAQATRDHDDAFANVAPVLDDSDLDALDDDGDLGADGDTDAIVGSRVAEPVGR